MRYLNLPHACVLLIATCLGVDALASPQQDGQTHRVLRAATKRADLYRRRVRIGKRFELDLAYVEEEKGWNGVSTFASQVNVKSHKPVLNLEEIEHHLADVNCKAGKMTLDFVDTSSARDAFHSCHGDDGGLIVTSHYSCNTEGERAVYRVLDVSFANDGSSLSLTVVEESWKSAFSTFDITFGHTTSDHIYRRHSDFAKIRKSKRQAVAIPSNTPNTTTAVSFNLASQSINTSFPINSFLALVPAPIPTLPIEMGCNNCTTTGKIALTQGAISIDASQIDVVPDVLQGGDDGKEISSIIKGGFFELSATDMSAHLDMFARPSATGAFEIALSSIPVLGFVIPGIGKAGAVFEPRIGVNFTVSGGVEVGFGVDVAVPNDSKLRIDLANPAKSNTTGFPASTLTPLPFTANLTSTSLLLSLAFKPTIPIGFSFSNDVVKAEVLVGMGLPRLDAKLSTDAGNCTATPSVGGLKLIEANATIAIDVGVGLNVPGLPPPFAQVELQANVFEKSVTLVKGCGAKKEEGDSVMSILASSSTVLVKPTSAVFKNGTMVGSASSTKCDEDEGVAGVSSTSNPVVKATTTGGAKATTTPVAKASSASIAPLPSTTCDEDEKETGVVKPSSTGVAIPATNSTAKASSLSTKPSPSAAYDEDEDDYEGETKPSSTGAVAKPTTNSVAKASTPSPSMPKPTTPPPKPTPTSCGKTTIYVTVPYPTASYGNTSVVVSPPSSLPPAPPPPPPPATPVPPPPPSSSTSSIPTQSLWGGLIPTPAQPSDPAEFTSAAVPDAVVLGTMGWRERVWQGGVLGMGVLVGFGML